MNKRVKTIMLITIGLLVLVTVTGIVYGMQNRINAKNIYSSYDENIISIVDDAINACQQAFIEVGATPEENEGLMEYVKNIVDAESPVLKAYLAQTMVTYTGDFVMTKEYQRKDGKEFSDIQKKLVNISAALRSARSYNQ